MERLNVGSGDLPAQKPWVNVDTWPGAYPDVVADVRQLPWPDGTVEQVYAGHVLEHLTPADVEVALAEIRRVLCPGGLLCIVGPDYDRAAGSEDPDPVLLDLIRDGGDRWEGDKHMWLSTETAALALVRKVFPAATACPIEAAPDGWPIYSRIWWQFAITATKEIACPKTP